MADKFYFGVPGAIQEVRPPESGMSFDTTVDTEVTELVSGGRSIYRAPTAFKSFSLGWKSGSTGLQHLINTYNGQFGGGPFYMTDPSAGQDNILPARWSNPYMLAYQANGWCRPYVSPWPIAQVPNALSYRSNRRLHLTQALSGSGVLLEGVLRTRHIRVPGMPYRLAALGFATGGAAIKVRGYNASTDSWVVLNTFTNFTGGSSEVLAATDTTYSMLELDIYMPLGSTLLLRGITFGTTDYQTTKPNEFMPPGQGVGAVQFSGTGAGTLVSSVIDRIGLTLDFTEVQNISNRTI